MHVIGTILAGWAARKACSWITSGASKVGEFDVSATYSHDPDDLTLRLMTGREIPGLIALLHILTPNDIYLKGVGEDQDNDGDFAYIRPFKGRECACRIPLGSIVYRAAGEYWLRVSCYVARAGANGPELKGRAAFRITLPEPRQLGRFAHYLPLVELVRYVVRCTETGRGARMRCMKDFFVQKIGMTEQEYDNLRDAVRFTTRARLPDVLGGIRKSAPNLDTESILNFLVQVAMSDDDFSAEEESLVREVARLRGMSDHDWERFAESEGLNRLNPWAVLGVRRGATPDEIRTAYRQLMLQNHPDRFAQSPKDFQELATKKTIAARQAYEQLMGAAGASA